MQPTPQPDSIPNIQKQIRRKIWIRAMKACVRLALVLCLLEFVVALFYSPHFHVKSVRVMGLQTLGEERVRFHSQALMGQPAVHPPTKFVRQQLMTVPVIESVRFGYASPRCMTVHVTERRPYFLLEGQKGQLLVGDRQGVIFRAEPSRSPQMPFVHVISEKEWTVGDRIPPEHVAKIRAAFAIIQRTHFPMPERFYYNNGFLSLRLADQTLVRLGKEDWEKKLLRARRAFAFFEKTGQMPEYLDFTSLHVPTWKPKKVN